MTATLATGLIVVGGAAVVTFVAGAILKKAVEKYGKMCFKKGAIAARKKDQDVDNQSIDPDTGEDIEVTAEDLDKEAEEICNQQIKSYILMYSAGLGIASFIGRLVGTIDLAVKKIESLGRTVENLRANPSEKVINFVVKGVEK